LKSPSFLLCGSARAGLGEATTVCHGPVSQSGIGSLFNCIVPKIKHKNEQKCQTREIPTVSWVFWLDNTKSTTHKLREKIELKEKKKKIVVLKLEKQIKFEIWKHILFFFLREGDFVVIRSFELERHLQPSFDQSSSTLSVRALPIR